jgi:hypothetical protein
MKLWQVFGITALSIGAMGGHAEAGVPERAPSTAQVNVCAADNLIVSMDVKLEPESGPATYEMWGEIADRIRRTLGHFRASQIRNNRNEVMVQAALISMEEKLKMDHGIVIAETESGSPPHGCGEDNPKVPLQELFVGQVDACIATQQATVSVAFAIVTNPTPEFRKDMEAAIGKTINDYQEPMSSDEEGLKKVTQELYAALTPSIIAVERRHGGETFPLLGGLQEGCHPARLGM